MIIYGNLIHWLDSTRLDSLLDVSHVRAVISRFVGHSSIHLTSVNVKNLFKLDGTAEKASPFSVTKNIQSIKSEMKLRTLKRQLIQRIGETCLIFECNHRNYGNIECWSLLKWPKKLIYILYSSENHICQNGFYWIMPVIWRFFRIVSKMCKVWMQYSVWCCVVELSYEVTKRDFATHLRSFVWLNQKLHDGISLSDTLQRNVATVLCEHGHIKS